MDTEIIREAHEARLLKRWLVEKRDSYATINHAELKTMCDMFDIGKEDESE